jgi:hypothetical protein
LLTQNVQLAPQVLRFSLRTRQLLAHPIERQAQLLDLLDQRL